MFYVWDNDRLSVVFPSMQQESKPSDMNLTEPLTCCRRQSSGIMMIITTIIALYEEYAPAV